MVQQSMRDGMSANQLEQLMSHLQSLPRDLRAGAPVECELSAAGLNCNAHGFAEQAMIAQLGAQIYRGNPGFRPIWLKRDSAGGWSATGTVTVERRSPNQTIHLNQGHHNGHDNRKNDEAHYKNH